MSTIEIATSKHDLLRNDGGVRRALNRDSDEGRKKRIAENQKRLDALGFDGYHMARDLEHIYDEVLREQYAPNSAMKHIPVDTSLPAGARKHTVRRIAHQGEVEVYRGGGSNGSIPGTSASQDSESFSTLTYVTGIRIDFFERQSADFANSNVRQELEIAANQSMRDFMNEKTWDGSEKYGLYGVLNYPWVPKTVSSVSFDSSGTPSDQLDELLRLANLAEEVSETVFAPNTLLLPTAKYNYIHQTDYKADSEKSIAQAFLEKQGDVDKIEKVPELKERGPNSEDVALFYRRRDKRSMVNMIAQGFSMLPVQDDGFDLKIPAFMQHGGVIMRDPLNNLVAYLS